MSVLLPATCAVLRRAHEQDPIFRSMMSAEKFEAEHTAGPLKLLPCTGGGFVVFDTRAPLGEHVLETCPTEELGLARLAVHALLAGLSP